MTFLVPLGMGEIGALYDRLTASRAWRDGRQWVLPLHSSVGSVT